MATISPEEFEALLRALEQDPSRRARLAALVLPPSLTAALEALAARVEELAAAQARTEARVEELAARVEELAAAQARTEQRLERLAAVVEQLAGIVRELRLEVEGLVGAEVERRYRERPYAYLHRIARRLRLLSGPELDDLLEDAVRRGAITEEEAADVRLADGIFHGVARDDRGEVYLVLEASVGVGLSDVERAYRRAQILARAGKRTEAVVAGRWIGPEAAAAAEAFGVRQVTDGRATA